MTRLIFISSLILLTACIQSKKEVNNDKQKFADKIENIDSSKVNHVLKNKMKSEVIDFECYDFDFHSPKEQADSLTSYLNRAKHSESTTRIDWERKFFCAFPNSFREMENLFGYNDDNGAAPLYEYPIGGNTIMFFVSLKSIPKDKFYDKFININIGGNWQADNIGEGFGILKIIRDDTEKFCQVLTKRTDSDIISVFRFIFDGPHPKNEYNEKKFNELIGLIDKYDSKISQLLTEAYNQLISEDDGHGR